MYFYNARWLDPYLNRWTSPDVIIPDPDNPLDWDRYSYVRNNPVRFTDPSGHMVACGLEEGNGCAGTGLGGLTPSQILGSNAKAEQEVRALYNYSVTHPAYNYALDPQLDDVGKFIVGNAIFLGNADHLSRKGTFWDRLFSSWAAFASGASMSIAAMLTGGGSDSEGIGGNTWRVGDPINTPTRNGYPSWSTAQNRYWQNRAATAIDGRFSPENLARMRNGDPPLHDTLGVPMELHHINGRGGSDPHNLNNLQEVWPWEHSIIDRYRYYRGPIP